MQCVEYDSSVFNMYIGTFCCAMSVAAQEDVWEARPQILHSDADTSGRRRRNRRRKEDSGYERLRDCTDITAI